jgi:serine/threonine-protein kinase
MQLREQLQHTLGSAYTLDRELGGAGMSRVFVAEDGRLRRKVVVKLLNPALAGGVNVERFTREIALAATLQHPCIVPLLSAGDMDGIPYYTMPLVEGPSLRQRLDEGLVPRREAVKVLRDIASALDAAHRRGVVHRDVKPENVLLSGDYAMVTDFGIAKALVAAAAERAAEQEDGNQLTERGLALGTPAYMAPEQIAGDENVDHRADIYSWGVVAYEVLSGETPFAGRNAHAVLAAHVVERPSPLTTRAHNIAPLLAALVMHALEKDPAARPQSAADLVMTLDALRAAPVTPDVSHDNSIAVLPFVNLSSDPESDYFSDGVTDEIIGTLARVKHLRVTGRASSFALKGTPLDLRAIGERLGVARVVEGTVRRVGNRVRISVELVDVLDGFQRWSDRFDRDLTDVFAVQEEIARAIARALDIASGSAPTALPSLADVRRPVHPEAYELYLKGLHSYRDNLYLGGIRRAVEYLEASVALDRSFAPVHSALGLTLYSLAIYEGKRLDEVVPKALDHVRSAIALDPDDAGARATLGYIRLMYEWDWESAQVHIDRALSLAPNDSYVLGRAATLYLCLGRLELAFTLAERSLATDPMSAYAHWVAGGVLLIGDNIDRAIAVLEAGLRIRPGYVALLRLLGQAYTYLDRFDEARRVLDQAVAGSNRHPWPVSELAILSARRGDIAHGQVLLDELLHRRKTEFISARSIGAVLMHLGRLDEAFVWLELAVDDREWLMAMWGVDRRWEPIRGDPRWKRIGQRIGIPS